MVPTEQPTRIVILPDRLVDQIAAGEVVERPFSVVKELIENSLDAAARNITIEITGAGSEEITVADDGFGMTPEEMELAVQRHATSKIRTADDLSAITSFGFRGEALPSIASVSHLEMVSRARDAEGGARRLWEAGTLTVREPAGAPTGTRIKVRNLFFNTPARKKFLKSATTETRNIIETVTGFAAAFAHLGFRLAIEKKDVLHTPPANTALDRMVDLFGAQLAERLLPFTGGEGDLVAGGFAGKPEIARPTRSQMLFFVNGRRVHSQSLAHAVVSGYGELIPKGRFPFAIVYVEINPQWVDVNVHPTKREVRFLHEHRVHDLVFYAINKALHTTSRTFAEFDGKIEVPNASPSPTPGPSLPLQWKRESRQRPQTSADGMRFVEQAYGPSVPHPTGGFASETAAGPEAPVGRVPNSDRSQSEKPDIDVSAFSRARSAESEADLQNSEISVPHPTGGFPVIDTGGIDNLWQFNNLYIFARAGDDLMMIDQHSAHERVLYEEMLRTLDGEPAQSQRILFPESIELEAVEYETFEQHLDLFGHMGFAVRPFGRRIALLEGAPTGLKQKNPVALFRWVLDDLVAAIKAGADLKSRAAASYACRAAVMAGDVLTQPEMRALFHRLFECENPYVCPHGRPTLVRIPLIEFDKKFCRRK